MKRMKLLLPILTIMPLFVISAKISNDQFQSDEEKQRFYVLHDYIKLTGRQNTKIVREFDVVSNRIPNFLTGKMYWFNDKGYSVISNKTKKIYEVNPDLKFDNFYLREARQLEYLGNGGFNETIIIEPKEKILPHERERDPNNLISSEYIHFKKSNYIEVKNAKTEKEFKKYKINKEKNGLIYADHEVANSWWFKVADYNNYGLNSEENSFIPNDNDEFQYYKKFPSYYTKSEQYLKKSNGGICGYVAINMLILYNELFESSGYYNSWERKTFLRIPNGSFNSYNDLKTNLNYALIPQLDSNFLKYLYQKTWFGGGVNYWWQAKYIAESILNNKWYNSKINYSYWGDYIFGQPWSTIVDYKRPTALAGFYTGVSQDDGDKKLWKSGHVIVAYGAYEDGRFLCNYGWDKNYSQMIISKNHVAGDYNFVINNKKRDKLEKMFNYNGVKYDGNEMNFLLKEKGYIK
ncbi:putative cysteine peptidase [Mycoplasma sp. 527]